ncbi:GNAT family N-acetyltransferase [Apibacter muscae]|nr:GNAT family N-acetyltransferase [Apibacter muscae]
MEKICIKNIKSKDVHILQSIAKQTFIDTFEEFSSPGDMELYCKNSFSLEQLNQELNNTNSQFYIAENENEIVLGYLKINFKEAQTELKDNLSLEIQRIYVLKDYQKQKVGQALLEKAMQIAIHDNLEYVWLGVWEENHKAISFYKKNGFIPFDKHVFRLGNEDQTDILMKKEIKTSNTIHLQPSLENDKILLSPLLKEDFLSLYKVASDPEIWEQHPNQNRWKKEIFEVFFNGAIESKGAFKILDKETNQIIGSTRYYNFNPIENSICIGYTFFSKVCWGKGINPKVKNLMLNYIFKYVTIVYFHVGSENNRSQIAIERLGAKKIDEKEITYYGEKPKLNFIYKIDKSEWSNS